MAAWTSLVLAYMLLLLTQFQREHTSCCLPVLDQPHELILFLNGLLWTKYMVIQVYLGIKDILYGPETVLHGEIYRNL